MKTKEIIKNKSRDLFNKKGFKNVTLREVADLIMKSYGNVTYHFSTKEQLLEELFADYNQSLILLQKENRAYDNLLHYLLVLPEFSFDLTVEYLFFYLDYIEIKRTYPKFVSKVEAANSERKEKWGELLLTLQKQGFLRSDLTIRDLDYIMELSAGVRMFYFQNSLGKEIDKTVFSFKVNQLLFPYLSEKGREYYSSFLKK